MGIATETSRWLAAKRTLVCRIQTQWWIWGEHRRIWFSGGWYLDQNAVLLANNESPLFHRWSVFRKSRIWDMQSDLQTDVFVWCSSSYTVQNDYWSTSVSSEWYCNLLLSRTAITLCPNTSNYLGRVFTEYSMYLGRVNNALSRRNSCRQLK